MVADEFFNLNERLQQMLSRGQPAHKEACSLIDRELGPIVKRFLRSRFYGASAEDIADAWQEMLVAFLEKAAVRGIDNPVSWVFGTTRNRLVDRLRRIPRETVVDASALEDISSPLDEWPDTLRNEAIEILSKMENPERVILSLRFLLGWRLRDIADALGMPISTVSSKVFRGLQRLRETLNSGADAT